MTVAEMLARISSRELTEWQAYFRLEKDQRDREAKELESKAKSGGKH